MAAFDAFAEALERDSDFPKEAMAEREWYVMPILNDGIYLMKCKRGKAASFLKTMADRGLPGGRAMRDAAECYEREEAVWYDAALKVRWELTQEEKQRRLASPAVRRELAQSVRTTKEHEQRAVEHLATALRQVKEADSG